MIYKIQTRSAFEFELREIIYFYKKINQKLAKQFLIRLKEAKQYLIDNPKGFEIRYKNARQIELKKFPYLIQYFINESEKTVYLIAITHSHKNPSDYTLR